MTAVQGGIMTTPPLKGIHHIKFAVSNLSQSLQFYEEVFHAKRIVEWDHKHANGSIYAHILEIPGLGTYIELRLNAEQAERHRLFNVLTIAVEDRAALEDWANMLDVLNVPHLPILVAIQAWLLVIEDPDQNRLRLYTIEGHGPAIEPDGSSPWLQD